MFFFLYINRPVFHQTTVAVLKMTCRTSGRRCLHKLAEYILLYFAVAIWKKAVPCLLFLTLKPASKALSSFCHSERKLWWKPTHFPRAHPHSLTVPSHMKGDCHSQRKRKRCGENMCTGDRHTEKNRKIEQDLRIYLSLFFLFLSHTDRKELLRGLNHTFEYRNWVHTGQMWHIILCDLIIRLLARRSYTTSVFHYSWRRGGARTGSWWRGSHGSWLGLDERSESLHPSSFRILLVLLWRWEGSVPQYRKFTQCSVSQEPLGSSTDCSEGLTHHADILLQIPKCKNSQWGPVE